MDETTTTIKSETYSLDKLENDEATEGFFYKCGEVFIKRGTEHLIFCCTICGEIYAGDLFAVHLKTDHSEYINLLINQSCIDAEAQQNEDQEPIKAENKHLYKTVQDTVIASDSANSAKFFEEVNWNEDNKSSSENSVNSFQLSEEDILNSKDRELIYIEDKHLNNEVLDEGISDSTNNAQACEKDNKNSSDFGELPDEDILNTKFTCKYCKNIFECVKDLKRHDCGLNKEVYQCEICQKVFLQKASLKHHKVTHESLKPHSCETCGASFAHINNLVVHVRRHTNERPFKCDFCEKAFVSSTEKKVHTRFVHSGERKFVCEICGMGHKSSSHLNGHRLRHLGIRNYKCTECDKSFYDAKSLRMHCTTHSDVPRSFKCELCTAGFKDKRALKQHSKIHDKVKNYSCKICSKTFAQHPGLYSHMKMHGVNSK